MPRSQSWRGNRVVPFSRCITFLAIELALLLWSPPLVKAQQRRGAPSESYTYSINYLHDGNYKDALDAFRSESRSAVKVGGVLWIDSICYLTMIGECHYQMGDLKTALESYTAALNLFSGFTDWMNQGEWGTARLQASATPRQTPWGISTRPTKLARYPQWINTVQGTLNTSDQVKRGGIITPAIGYPVQAQEIVRATALALRRRAELVGPMAKYDKFGQKLLAQLKRPIAPRNHWVQSWADLELGLAALGADSEKEAISALTRSLTAAGEFDHPMTGMALLELGKIALRKGDYPGAGKMFLEATYSAYYYNDFITVEEAFRYAALCHILANQKGPFAPALDALRWTQSRGRDIRHLQASLAVTAAESLLIQGQTAQAATALNEAQQICARRTMAAGVIGARLSYLRATQFFQQRNIADGEKALAAAMRFMQNGGSLWLFHIAQADLYITNGQRTRELASRQALELYQYVLRDPQPLDWVSSPIESLAVLMTPHPGPLERLFYASMGGVDEETSLAAALDVSDRVRRHRFFSSLPFGGRLMALRWVLEAPEEVLDNVALAQRRALMAQYPAYQAASTQAAQIRGKLAQQPIATGSEAAREQSGSLWNDLAKATLQQEAILREMAVRREPASLVFPPVRPMKEIQQGLPDGAAVLSFLSAGGQYHAFLLNRSKCIHWTIKNSAQLGARIAGLLREMGNIDANRQVGADELSKTQWKEYARQVLEGIVAESRADFGQKFSELIIVPDGMFWYLPFEALQVKVDNDLHSLISRVRMRYAPTLGLAIADPRGRKDKPETAFVLGRLFPKSPPETARNAFDQIAKTIPEAIAVDRPLSANSALAKWRVTRLAVLSDITMSEQHGAYGWAPMEVDRGKPGSTLADWMTLPWGGPEVVVLPGFHTVAEKPSRGSGNEIFLSLCGLLSTGTRTVLMSRWRTGGQSSFDLVREFLQELPQTTPADAWQRAVFLIQESRLSPEGEPRVKSGGEEVKGSHPFIWSGYLLVDCGDPVERRMVEPGKDSGDEKVAPPKPGAKPVPGVKPEAKPEAKPEMKPESKPEKTGAMKSEPPKEVPKAPAEEKSAAKPAGEPAEKPPAGVKDETPAKQ